MTQQGIELLKLSTLALIADDPTVITLNPARGTVVPKPGGGEDVYAGDPRAEQTFKIVAQSSDNGLQDSDTGVTRTFEYVLIGAHDAEVEIGDFWTDGDDRYTVTGILSSTGYEIKASVTCQGKAPNYG